MRLLYTAFAIAVLLGYGAVGFNGYELGGGEKKELPQNARQASGGWRSFHFWHVGYMGGK